MSTLRSLVWLHLLCLLILPLLAATASAKEKAEDEARSLLKTAVERSLFHADSNFPFTLTASFTVHHLAPNPLQGTYGWLVTPKGDWKKITSFADYSDLQVKLGSDVWIKRSTDFQPLQAALVQNAFGNQQYLDQPGDTIDRVFTTSEHHLKLRCADFLHGKQARTFCIDPEQNLRKIEFKDSKIEYEYSDYRPAGQKFAPYKIAARRQGRTLLEVQVDGLSIDIQPSPRPLEIPEGAIKRNGCLAPTLPTLNYKVVPEYPKDARAGLHQGQVMLYVLIGSDGIVHNAVVTQTAGPSLDSSVMNAVRRWRFDPAKCGDIPVEFETEIPVNFSLELR